MFKLQELIRRDINKLASDITTEQGKTLKDAFNDISRGIELVEHACGMTNLHMGDFISNISNGIDTHTTPEPLGVCAGWDMLVQFSSHDSIISALYFFPFADFLK